MDTLGLAPSLLAAALAMGWHRPTTVQAALLRPALAGRDVLALAPTGAGKTGAFLLPLLNRLLAEPGLLAARPRPLRALVLSPTRELAAQTAAVAQALAPGLKLVLAVGGLSVNPQMMALRGGAHLVVATPGRVLDLLARQALRLDGVHTLVLDEADRLLDLGFTDELRQLLARLPTPRQTLLFSATEPADLAVLGALALNDPVRVDTRALGADAPAPLIRQRAIVVDTARRTPLLRALLREHGWPRVLVFVATQVASERVARKLQLAGVPAAALHGQLSAGRRSTVLADFQQHRLQVLVATDLAARGLDVPELGVVVNHDLARSVVDHVHRIGRTARAGASGLGISFIAADAPGSELHFRLIEKRQQQRLPREVVTGFEPADRPADLSEAEPVDTQGSAPAARSAPGQTGDPNGGIKGRRLSKKDRLRAAAALKAR
jgi:ATP-dependent RNA helicase RhlE